MFFSISDELRYGLKQTANYILSHHEPAEYYKCHHIKFTGIEIYICSRCLGVYLGILIGVLIVIYNLLNPIYYLFIIDVFPLLALADWSITTFTSKKSNNSIRSITGLFLGFSYMIGVFCLILNLYIIKIICIAIIYSLIAIAMLYIKFNR